MSEIFRLNFINIKKTLMDLVNRQSSRQNALSTVSRGVDYKNNIDLLKKKHDIGLAPILVIWSQQIRSYLRLNESLESNISKTFSKRVSILLLSDHFSIHVLWVIHRPVRDGSGKCYMIVFFSPSFRCFYWRISRWPRMLKRLIALAYPSQN